MSNPSIETQRQPLRELALILIGIVVLVSVSVGAWMYLRPMGEQSAELDAARELLASLQTNTDASERLDAAKAAESKLREYLEHGTQQKDAAELLLLAARLVQGPVDGFVSQVKQLDLSAVPTSDLLTTAFITQSRQQPAIADLVILEALDRKAPSDAELRGDVLRLATMIHYELGRSEEVLAYCQELIEMAPADPGPYRVMAFVFEDRQDFNQLAETLRELIQRMSHPEDDPFQLQYIEALIVLGQAADARAEFDSLQKDSPQLLADAPLVRAKLLELEGRRDEALAVAKTVLSHQSDNVEALALVARVHSANDELADAVTQLQRILELTPSDEKVHYQLGKILARQGKLDEAQKHLNRHRELLDTKVELNRLERVAAQRPADVKVRKHIASLYRSLGWDAEARFWDHAAETAMSITQ